ncbi:hypothetical protein [Paraburkholderia solisilvae]|nr:hypothetical protein [Paraburkholderia solisilvae]
MKTDRGQHNGPQARGTAGYSSASLYAVRQATVAQHVMAAL